MKSCYQLKFLFSMMVLTICNISSNAINNKLYFCTAANSGEYFYRLVNLIGSIHKNNFNNLGEVFVYDIGLNDQEIQYLNSIEKVSVQELEKVNPDITTPFRTTSWGKTVPSWYAFKYVALKNALEKVPYVLWIDAGNTVLKPIDSLFEHVIHEGYFLGTIGSEETNGKYAFDAGWGMTKYVEKKFLISLPENKWVRDKESVMGNVIGVSRKGVAKFLLPIYLCAHDLKNFEDDGSTRDGFGTGRHDQVLLSIFGYLNDLQIFKQDHTQKEGMHLNNSENLFEPFFITWDKNYVSNKTHIYSSRNDLSNFNYYLSCIHFK